MLKLSLLSFHKIQILLFNGPNCIYERLAWSLFSMKFVSIFDLAFSFILSWWDPRSLQLKTGYRYENQFWNPGLGSFVDINIFVMKHYFMKFLHIPHFLRISSIKIYKMLRPQKGNSEVLFNDTLLNFRLRNLLV